MNYDINMHAATRNCVKEPLSIETLDKQRLADIQWSQSAVAVMPRTDIPKIRYKVNFVAGSFQKEPRWKCNKCDKLFTSYRDLRQHKKSVHCY
jgi:hypothetical protein